MDEPTTKNNPGPLKAIYDNPNSRQRETWEGGVLKAALHQDLLKIMHAKNPGVPLFAEGKVEGNPMAIATPQRPEVSPAQRDAAIVTRYRDLQSLRLVADEMGLSHERIRQVLAAAGLPPRPPKGPKAASSELLVRLYVDSQYSIQKAASHAGVSKQTARILLQRAGVKLRERGAKCQG